MARPFGFRQKPLPIEEPAINLTALIDVVFVVLIMFILIAPLLELDRVELAPAPSVSSLHSVQETSPLAVHVQKDNSVYVNKALVPLNQLTAKLKKAKLQFPKARPQLFHDRQAAFGTYQSVKNAFEEAGFEEVDVVLKPS